MTRIGAMNLMLHGIDNPNFRYTDTLSKAFAEKGQYDVILANPPFKGSIDKSDINERFTLKTTKTELLFIELMNSLLVTGGRCGVIVPDGVLFGTSNAHVDLRKILVDKCKLEGVISMPSGVFKPYAGVSTAVLIFQKGGTTDNLPASEGQSGQAGVWFYDMVADGFSLDDKRQKIAENDIPDIVKQWQQRNNSHPERQSKGVMRKAAEPTIGYTGHASTSPDKSSRDALSVTSNGRAGKCFLVPADEIRANKYDLSVSRYKQIEHVEVEYENPDVIMHKVSVLEKEIGHNIDEIRLLLR